MVYPITRRTAIKGAISTAFSTSFAGCGEDNGTPTATQTPESTPADDSAETVDTGIPGVKKGEVVDAREIAKTHEETLQERSGRIIETESVVNLETGQLNRAGVRGVEVDGDRVFAVLAGDMWGISQEAQRREEYIEDDNRYIRRRIDDRWDAKQVELGSVSDHVAQLTGRSRLELLLGNVTLVGPTSHTEEEFLFRQSSASNEEKVEWLRNHVTVTQEGLCTEWGQTTDEVRGGTSHRSIFDARIENLLETVVTRPDWVDEIDT